MWMSARSLVEGGMRLPLKRIDGKNCSSNWFYAVRKWAYGPPLFEY